MTTKKKRRSDRTPPSIVKHALRLLWLHSRERRAALEATGYRCARLGCGAKHSRAKGREVTVEVHHLDGIDWDELVAIIRGKLLPHPSRLWPLCRTCHPIADAAARKAKKARRDPVEDQRIERACRGCGMTSAREIEAVAKRIRALCQTTAFGSDEVVATFELLMSPSRPSLIPIDRALTLMPRILSLAAALNCTPRALTADVCRFLAEKKTIAS